MASTPSATGIAATAVESSTSSDAVMVNVAPATSTADMEGIIEPSLAAGTGNMEGIPPVTSITPSVMDEDRVVAASVTDNRPRRSWNEMEEECPTPVHPSPVSMSDIVEASPTGNNVGPADDDQGSSAPMQTEPVIVSGRPASEAGGTEGDYQVIDSRMDECDTVASMSVAGTDVGAAVPRRWQRSPSDASNADLHTSRNTALSRGARIKVHTRLGSILGKPIRLVRPTAASRFRPIPAWFCGVR